MKNLYSGWLWEHGSFGLAAAKIKPLHQIGDTSVSLRHGREWERVVYQGLQCVFRRRYRALAWQSSLNGTPAPRPRARRGLKGISSYGRKIVAGSCYRLEQESPAMTLTFATLTLPHVSPEMNLAVAEQSSRWLKVLNQRIKRRLQSSGLPGEIVAVLEFQPKRRESSGLPVLHVHMVFRGRHTRRSAWVISYRWLREVWREVMISVHPDFEQCDFSASENVQPVKRSAAAYLGKYLSKGAEYLGPISSVTPEYVPRSWWSVSHTLRQRVLAARVKLAGEIASAFLGYVEPKPADVIYIRSVKIATQDGCEISVGKYGRLKPDSVSGWRDLQFEYREVLKCG